MRKWVLLFAGGLAVLFFFLIPLLAGGMSSAAEPISQIASVDRTLVYAETASKLGAPWDIVMLTDAVYAAREEEGGIEDVNPIHTSLQFAIMTITVEKWEVVSRSYDAETGTWDEEYDWVFDHNETYTAKDEITGELKISDDALGQMSADDFTDAMTAEMERRSGSKYRYSAAISANYDFDTVLHSYTTLKEDEIAHTLELYDADYLMQRMDAETQEKVRLLMGEYGMYQFVDLETYVNCEGVTYTNGDTSVVYYNQLDERWAEAPYGADRIGTHGCGPTAMAIVISSLTGENVDPVYMANWSNQNGYCVKGKGSAHALIPAAAEAFGLSCSGCTRSEPQRIVDALARGDLVVALMTKGHFTNGGHFIVLRGVTEDGKILVADPASTKRSNQTWDLSLIVNETHKSAAAGGPFWIISR